MEVDEALTEHEEGNGDMGGQSVNMMSTTQTLRALELRGQLDVKLDNWRVGTDPKSGGGHGRYR